MRQELNNVIDIIKNIHESGSALKLFTMLVQAFNMAQIIC